MKRGRFIAFAVIPGVVLLVSTGFTGCQSNQNQASASLPAASMAAYPESQPAAFPVEESSSVSGSSLAQSEKKPEPFSLRDGENLVPHQVESGETLSGLAAKYKTSIRRIQSANDLKNTRIYAGRTYQIPTRMSAEEIASTALAAATVGAKPESSPPSAADSAPPSSARTRYEPASIPPYSGDSPETTTPEESAAITIPPLPGENGSGSAFPTPSFGY